MLRVLIDASALPENRGGVGRYVDELVARLPALGVDTHVVVQARDAATFAERVGAEQVHPVAGWAGPPAPRLAWEQTGLPLLVHRLRPDVVHSPHYTLPLPTSAAHGSWGSRLVVTLHDATFFSDPHLHTAVKGRFFRTWTSFSARRADALIAPSEATRAEVVRHTGVDVGRVDVVPHGVDHDRFRPPSPDEVAEVRAWLGVGDRSYVAFLGTLEPRKNVPALVRAFGAVCASMADPPALVLAGGKGWDDGVDPAVAALPGHLQVVRPGFVPDGLVPALLGGAAVVAYSAFGEGFGLPVLEAMACGAAALTTRGLALEEVGGEAVRYAASPDTADIAQALAALLADPDERARLRVAGIERAAGYTWEASARGHLAVYERVADV